MTMLRDEAVCQLLRRLEEAPFATMRIFSDNGIFQASYATGVTACHGAPSANLTDALVSLAENLGSPDAT